MTPSKQALLVPILLITIGCGWLLTTLGIAPEINWVWTLGLAVAGILPLALNGIDKTTIVIGPLLLIASCLSVLRQTGRLTMNVEMPILVIVVGLLLLVARSKAVPAPRWLVDESSP